MEQFPNEIKNIIFDYFEECELCEQKCDKIYKFQLRHLPSYYEQLDKKEIKKIIDERSKFYDIDLCKTCLSNTCYNCGLVGKCYYQLCNKCETYICTNCNVWTVSRKCC